MDREPHHVRKGWNVAVEIDEHDGQTRAKARLRWRDQEAVGVGLARLAPSDRYFAQIGDELAVARALSDLARRVMTGTVQHIEANEPLASHAAAGEAHQVNGAER